MKHDSLNLLRRMREAQFSDAKAEFIAEEMFGLTESIRESYVTHQAMAAAISEVKSEIKIWALIGAIAYAAVIYSTVIAAIKMLAP